MDHSLLETAESPNSHFLFLDFTLWILGLDFRLELGLRLVNKEWITCRRCPPPSDLQYISVGGKMTVLMRALVTFCYCTQFSPRGVDELVDLHVAPNDQVTDGLVTAASESEPGKLDPVNKYLKLAGICLDH